MVKGLTRICIFCLLLCGLISASAQIGPWYKVLRDDYASLGNTTISYIEKDEAGRVWLLGFGAIASYDGNDYKHYPVPKGMKGPLIRLFHGANDEMIVQDKYGQLFYLEGEEFRPHPANDEIVALNPKARTYWTVIDSAYAHMAIPKKRYIKIDTSGHISYPFQERNLIYNGIAVIPRKSGKPMIVHARDTNLKPTDPKYIHIFTEELKLVDSLLFRPNKPYFPLEYTTLTNGNFLISDLGILFECNADSVIQIIPYTYQITGLLTDSKGGLWISTNYGLDYYPEGKIDSTKRKVVLKNQFCVVREEDYQGGVWVHTHELGAIHIQFPQYEHYSKDNYLCRNGVISLQYYQDTLFYSTIEANYLHYIDHKNMDTGRLVLPKHLSKRYGIIDQFAIPEQSKLWISERGQLNYREKGKWKVVATDQLEENYYFSKYYIQAADIEGFDFGGFYENQYFLGKEDSLLYVSPPFPELILSAIFLEDSTFIGTTEGLYLKTSDTLIPLHERYDALASSIGELSYFDHKVWISSTKAGLYSLSKDTLEKVSWNDVDIASGITLMKENEQYLWAFGTNYSFRIGVGNQIDHFPSVAAFSEGNESPYYHDGSIYALNARRGILKMRFKDIASNPLPAPKVYFDEIRFDTTIASLEDSVFILDHTNNSIRISYAGVNYRDLPIVYRYRLGENQKRWESTNGDDLFLIGLPPGTYPFELQTKIGYQDWISSKKLTFIITPPIWKTTWFITLVSGLLIALIIISVRLRIRQISKQNDLIVQNLLSEQKVLRAKLDPHFVFNVISSAQSLVLRESREKAAHFLQLFSKQLRNVLDNSNKNIYTINDEVKVLREYIDLEYYRSGENFRYIIDVAENINGSEEKILPLIIQPFVENAILHGLRLIKTEGMLSIRFSLEGEYLKIVIEDNGIGREAAKQLRTKAKIKQQSHGINICRERLALHNQSSIFKAVLYEDLLSEEGEAKGTRVTINMKRIKS